TMVTAGVFMVARLSPLFELSGTALWVVTLVGATTAFFAATVGLVQNDIKRVVAYSTCSQLGYMFVAIGVGAYAAGIFHLFTHAFFKALLFLGSGSVIHAMHDEQDMRRMGGLYKLIPLTWGVMLVGTLALTGFPLTAGYYSKDAIIEAAFAAHSGIGMYAFVLTVVAAMFTSFYSWRLIFMTFHGTSRAEPEVLKGAHESPPVMLVPLFLLALGSIGAGFLFKHLFIGGDYGTFWRSSLFTSPSNNILEALHHVPFEVKAAPFVMMAIGLATAVLFYLLKPSIPAALARAFRPLYLFLLNKWYFDELYDFLFTRPAKRLGRFLWKVGDGAIIDGLGPDGVAARVIDVTNRIVRLQTGYVYHYAFAMLIGVALLATYFMFAGGGAP
ncbi:MAG: NADH-quinone oxidoreductase subunit L, partial [Methyloligellaceae bacterium]